MLFIPLSFPVLAWLFTPEPISTRVSNLRKVCGPDSAVRRTLGCGLRPDYLAAIPSPRSSQPVLQHGYDGTRPAF